MIKIKNIYKEAARFILNGYVILVPDEASIRRIIKEIEDVNSDVRILEDVIISGCQDDIKRYGCCGIDVEDNRMFCGPEHYYTGIEKRTPIPLRSIARYEFWFNY